MEPGIDGVDEFVGEVRSEFRVIDVRLTTIEARLDTMNSAMATRVDIAVLESIMLKWFICAVITIAGVACAAAKLIH